MAKRPARTTLMGTRLREFWLGSETLVATEVLTTPDSSAILAVKR